MFVLLPSPANQRRLCLEICSRCARVQDSIYISIRTIPLKIAIAHSADLRRSNAILCPAARKSGRGTFVARMVADIMDVVHPGIGPRRRCPRVGRPDVEIPGFATAVLRRVVAERVFAGPGTGAWRSLGAGSLACR